MPAPRGNKLQIELIAVHIVCFALLLGFFGLTPGAFGQEPVSGSAQHASPPQEHAHSETVTPLQDLLTEAEQNNPQIHAAQQGWQAAKQVPTQVSTLPDPQFSCSNLVLEVLDPSRATRTAISPTSASGCPRTFRIPENYG